MKKAVFVLLSLLLMVSIAAIPSDAISAKPASSSHLSAPSAIPDPKPAKELVGNILKRLEMAKQCIDRKHKAEFEAVLDLIDTLTTQAEALETEIDAYIETGKPSHSSNAVDRYGDLRKAIVESIEWLATLDVDREILQCVQERLSSTGPYLKRLYKALGGLEEVEADEGEPEDLTPAPTPSETARPPEEIEKLPGYSVKIVCGPTFGKEGVKQGAYSVVINIHNPSNKTITIWIKAVKAKSMDEARGKISGYREVKLKPGEAIKVKCSDIRNMLSPSGEAEESISAIELIDGFAVIKSTTPLHVVAIYTSETPGGSNFQVKDCSPSSAATVPLTARPTEEEVARPTTEVTPAPTEVTPSPPEEEAAKLGEIIIDPASDSNEVGTMHSITIKVFDTGGSPVPNAKVHVSQSGAHTGTIALVTGTDGKAGYHYIGQNAGTDTIVATVDNLSATAIKEWYIPETEQPETGPAKLTPPTTEPETGPADLTPTTESDLAE